MSRREPRAAAEFLGRVPDRDPAHIAEACERLWDLTRTLSADFASNPALGAAIAVAASKIMPFIQDDEPKTRLIITKALGCPLEETRRLLMSSWRHVSDDAFWLAVEALPDVRLVLIQNMLDGGDTGRNRSYLLESMPPSLLPPSNWPELRAMLWNAARNPGLQRACALAVEDLLYVAEGFGVAESFQELALHLARSPSDDVRLPLTYFAGSRPRSGTAKQIAARDKIFEVLIDS
jgi:hypothetical protein